MADKLILYLDETTFNMWMLLSDHYAIQMFFAYGTGLISRQVPAIPDKEFIKFFDRLNLLLELL